MRVEFTITHPARFYQSSKGDAVACIAGRVVDLPEELAEALLDNGVAIKPSAVNPAPVSASTIIPVEDEGAE